MDGTGNDSVMLNACCQVGLDRVRVRTDPILPETIHFDMLPIELPHLEGCHITGVGGTFKG